MKRSLSRKIILCIVATILSFLVFDILFDFGFLGSAFIGQVPMTLDIVVIAIIALLSLTLWIGTLRKILKNDWQTGRKKS